MKVGTGFSDRVHTTGMVSTMDGLVVVVVVVVVALVGSVGVGGGE